MIRIRIKDTDNIQYKDKQHQYSKQNRHGAIVKSFLIVGGRIEFFDDKLDSRMIPKKHDECFCNIPFKQIITDSKHSLTFQDPNNTLHLLKCEDGWIQSVNFDDITEDDDIIIYDENENEWAISGISEIKYWNTSIENEDYNKSSELQEEMFYNMSKSLSQYMISINSGLIINNILII